MTTQNPISLWINGQTITNADFSNPGGKLAGLPAWFRQGLQSLQAWWASPGDNSGTKVQVWGAAPASPGSTQPAGEVLAVVEETE